MDLKSIISYWACLAIALSATLPVWAQNPAPLPPAVAAQAAQDGFIRAARELRERTGRDNALIMYQEASFLAPGPDDAQDELLVRVVREGWSAEAHALMPYLQRWAQALELIRQGVAVNFAEGVGYEDAPATPVLDFLFAQMAPRVLSAQGRYFESIGEYERALYRYLTALRMGRDYGCQGSLLVSTLISIAMQSTAHGPLGELVKSGVLTDEQLQQAQRELNGVEAIYGGVVAAWQGEKIFEHFAIERTRKEIRQAEDPDIPSVSAHERAFITDLRRQIGDEMMIMLKDEKTRYYDALIENMALEPHEFDYAEFRQHMSNIERQFRNQLSGIELSSWMPEARVREDVMIAKRRLLITQIALERYHLQHDQYPDTLDALRGTFLDELPTDPFSGEPFRYQPSDDRADYTMYCLGPDKTDNPTAGEYDPANGTFSPGVIR